jgi:hypothetical protein
MKKLVLSYSIAFSERMKHWKKLMGGNWERGTEGQRGRRGLEDLG